MKKWLAVIIIGSVCACKSANIATPAPNAATKRPVDTSFQGDKVQDPAKP